ncbi:MAG: hypothetical protein R2863_08515 [Candidatus Kapaibacterium sp.]|nr:hypothetical protein [Ignavibacteria bacterium]
MQIVLLYFLILIYSSNSFETIKGEKVELNKIDNYLLIIMDGMYCHDCLVKLNNVIDADRKIKSIVAFKSQNGIILNKTLINNSKKYITPDIWVFYKEDNLFANFNTSVSPNVILKTEDSTYYFHYENLFTGKDNRKVFNNFKKIYKEICYVYK